MATATKTKPTPKKPAAKKAAPKRAPKAKATAEKAPATPSKLFEVGDLVKFKGYRSEMADDTVVFNEGDTIYITEVDDEGESGILYSGIKAADAPTYLAAVEAEEEDPYGELEAGQVSPSEISELKGGALEKAKDQFMPVARVGRLAELMDENDDAVEVAIELGEDIQQTYFWLGGALAIVLQRGSYLKENGGEYEGDDAFNDFCQDNFGFKASKGRDLARVYRTFSSLPNFDPASLAAVGWSKAAIAERFVTEDNVADVIETASDTTQRELATTLKEKYTSATGTTSSGRQASRGPNIVTKTMSFKLDEDSADTVQLAIDACKKQYGIESDSFALERIVTEWANDHIEAATVKKRVATKASKAAKARAAAAKSDAK